MNPDYKLYKDLYATNKIAFKTQTDLVESNLIQNIAPPYPSFTDKKNKRGGENYARYLNLGNYIAYPQICLDGALGICNKEFPEVKLPTNLQDIIDYATVEGTNILNIQNQIMSSIFKYGLAGIKINIAPDVNIADSLPRLEVIDGYKIVDFRYNN